VIKAPSRSVAQSASNQAPCSSSKLANRARSCATTLAINHSSRTSPRRILCRSLFARGDARASPSAWLARASCASTLLAENLQNRIVVVICLCSIILLSARTHRNPTARNARRRRGRPERVSPTCETGKDAPVVCFVVVIRHVEIHARTRAERGAETDDRHVSTKRHGRV